LQTVDFVYSSTTIGVDVVQTVTFSGQADTEFNAFVTDTDGSRLQLLDGTVLKCITARCMW
jgi:hypothetical protein